MAQDSKQDLLQDQEGDSELVRQLRAEIRERDSMLNKTNASLKEIEKKDVFRSIGVDPSKGVARLFFEKYDGELTEEAVKAAAEEYEVPLSTPNSPETQGEEKTGISAEEKEAHSRMNGASAGAEAPAPANPASAGREAYDRTFRQTGNEEAARASMFNAKMTAALEAQKAKA